MNNLHEQLTHWGAAQRTLPPRNAALRAELLERAHARPVAGPAERPRRVPWLTFALAGAAVFALFLQSTTPRVTRTIGNDGRQTLAGSRAPETLTGLAPTKTSIAPQVYMEQDADATVSFTQPAEILPWPEPVPPYPVPDGVPIRDDRELLRTDYAAQLRTRHVAAHSERIATTVRGYSGRVDRATSSAEYGVLQVALPADRLDAFRAELRTLVRAPFLMETVTSENLLPQQRTLEERAEDITGERQRLAVERDALIDAHERTLAELRAALHSLRTRLDATRAEEPSNTAGIVAKAQRVTALERDIRIAESRVATENRAYEAKRRTLDHRIGAQDDALATNADAQSGIQDTVATVRATITLQRITLAGMARVYLAQYWIGVGIGILALVTMARWYRRSAVPLVQ